MFHLDKIDAFPYVCCVLCVCSFQKTTPTLSIAIFPVFSPLNLLFNLNVNKLSVLPFFFFLKKYARFVWNSSDKKKKRKNVRSCTLWTSY